LRKMCSMRTPQEPAHIFLRTSIRPDAARDEVRPDLAKGIVTIWLIRVSGI
jgi:hypothetical protein